MLHKAQQNNPQPGLLDVLILRTLSLRNIHGYGIVQFIQQSSGNDLLAEEGSLYPTLQRLELTDRRCVGCDAEKPASEDLQDHVGWPQATVSRNTTVREVDA